MSGALLDLATPVQDGLAWLVIGAVMLIYLKQHGLISQN